ncbi:hypothetical protein Tco_1334024 [Tanacetum coccineum]
MEYPKIAKVDLGFCEVGLDWRVTWVLRVTGVRRDWQETFCLIVGFNENLLWSGGGSIRRIQYLGYGILRHRYAVSSLMDMEYWLSEQ